MDKYPLEISKKVLKVLIENSCLGQNCGPIELGRKKINEMKEEIINIGAQSEIEEVKGVAEDYTGF